jgi:hypothetical protein
MKATRPVFIECQLQSHWDLRGYDAFLNVVLEESTNPEGENLGTVVIRGNSIIKFEGLERVQ